LSKELSWEDAIQTVLREAGTTLRAPEISERILAQRLREKVGATPASTVAAIISISLKEEDSPFLKVGRGQFALKNVVGTNVDGIVFRGSVFGALVKTASCLTLQ
jgi:hypothetical protein